MVTQRAQRGPAFGVELRFAAQPHLIFITSQPPAKLGFWRGFREHRSGAKTKPKAKIGARRHQMR